MNEERTLEILRDIKAYAPTKIRSDNLEGLEFNMNKLHWIIDGYIKEIEKKQKKN